MLKALIDRAHGQSVSLSVENEGEESKNRFVFVPVCYSRIA
jgi:hypothetical protein